MHRAFAYLNVVLLLLLGATCVYQWRRESDYRARVEATEKRAADQARQLAVLADDLRRATDDLGGFKQTVATLTQQSDAQSAALREEKARAFALDQEKQRLTQQLAAWQHAVEQHRAALASRDENLKTLLGQRDQLVAAQRDAAAKANDAVSAYNQLAKRYEDVVGRYNALATQANAGRPAAEPAGK